MPAAGVPASFPVAAVKVTPDGNVPDSDSVGVGEPVAVTVKEPAVPTVKLVLLTLVIVGAVNVFVLTLKPTTTEDSVADNEVVPVAV